MSAATRLLIVEDEYLVALGLKQRLQTLGYEVCGTTGRADEAIHLSRELQPDIALMDIHLAGDGDGIEAARAIHAERKIPVVFLTAHADGQTVRRVRECLPYGYLVKPCESRALHAALQTALVLHASEVQAANRELEQRVEQLALASKYKSEFLANMSHELRTPLNSMLILSRLLADNDEHNLTQRQVDYANVIHSAGLDLLERIDDVLDLTRIEAGHLEIEVGPTPIAAVCEAVRREFGEVAERKGLAFRIELAPGLPQAMHTDERRLRQILHKLLGNAFKFTHAGGVRLDVARAGPELAFSVSDTGIGIAPDKLALIFEAFHQVDGSATRRYRGCGLGLTICRQLSRILGGRIDVDSTLGAGSRFTLYLPLQIKNEAPPPATA